MIIKSLSFGNGRRHSPQPAWGSVCVFLLLRTPLRELVTQRTEHIPVVSFLVSFLSEMKFMFVTHKLEKPCSGMAVSSRAALGAVSGPACKGNVQ